MKHLHTVADGDLIQRWPDPVLSDYFRRLLTVYENLYANHLRDSNDRKLSVSKGYRQLCRWIAGSPRANSPLNRKNPSDRAFVETIVLAIRQRYGGDWLQSIASVLAMLMHFTPGSRGSRLLVNHRRPQRSSSTYPNSPAVAKFLGDAVVARLFKRTIPAVCNGSAEAERYAEVALDFRILDPSMESGQLLLAATLAIVRLVHNRHLSTSKEARYLTQSVLKKLCADCLWGIDRNELATAAVKAIFAMLGEEFGLQRLAPRHLLTADALERFSEKRIPKFDAIANNPPWGEPLRSPDRIRLRKQFSMLEHWSDTYVAFGELAIRCLQPNGVFALILPSQLLATRNATRLRGLFINETSLERMIVLPHSAFTGAKVRGLTLIGRAKPTGSFHDCLVTVYPIVRRFDAIGSARSVAIKPVDLRQLEGQSWLQLINLPDSIEEYAPTLPLGRIADIASGVKLYEKGAGTPRQTARTIRRQVFTLSNPSPDALPAIRGRDIRDFHVAEPTQFVKFGRWLAWIGPHEQLRQRKRIFLRELCSSEGKITAAAARDGFIPLHGVITILPNLISVGMLTGILNSATTAEYVRRHAASMSKVDFQRITISELRLMPIPVAAIGPRYRRVLNLRPPTDREHFLRRRLSNLVRKCSETRFGSALPKRMSLELDNVVKSMYEQKGT
jgi:hypothetical protein